MIDTYLIEKCASYANDACPDFLEGISIEDAKTGCRAFVILNQYDIIIMGYGTTTTTDWTLRRKKVSYLENTMVHSGFIKQYAAVRDRIHEEVNKHLQSKMIRKIVCTGHNLFGAISTIIALDCAIKYPVQVCCVTFGSPRVGNSAFARLFNKLVITSFRCVRHNDPIVFSQLPYIFTHVRGCVHFEKEIRFHVPLCNLTCCKVSHHNMGDYLQSINKINDRKLEIFLPWNYVDTYLGHGDIRDTKNIRVGFKVSLADYDDDDVSGTSGVNKSISSGEFANEVESGDEDEYDDEDED